jgi:hypothetical protein
MLLRAALFPAEKMKMEIGRMTAKTNLILPPTGTPPPPPNAQLDLNLFQLISTKFKKPKSVEICIKLVKMHDETC